MLKDATLEVIIWVSGGVSAGFAGSLIIDVVRYLMGS